MRRHARRILSVSLAVAALFSAGVVGIVPLPSAAAATVVSDDCDTGGVNINDGTISGTYLKLKTKTPSTGVLWVCYRVDRGSDPVIHEGGKLTLGTSSEPVVDNDAGYCATQPEYVNDVEGTVGPEQTPVLVHRLTPPYSLDEIGVCIRVGSVLFRASAAVRPDLDNKIERDLVTCQQVAGVVADQDGNPISGATMQQIGDAVDGCASSGMTTAEGEYVLQARVAMPAQTVTVRAERNGYQAEEVVVPAGDPTNTLANFNLWLDAGSWSDPGCEEEGNPLAGTAACTPPADLVDGALAPVEDECVGSELCGLSLEEIALEGFDVTPLVPLEAHVLAQEVVGEVPPTPSFGPSAASASSVTVHYGGYFFWLTTNPRDCSNFGSKVWSSRCGFLGHWFVYTQDGRRRVKWTIVPASSSDNNPARECVVSDSQRGIKGGPINVSKTTRDGSYAYYRVGRMNGRYTSFEWRNEEPLYPGVFRLDPWVVRGCPGRYPRGEFEFHGGSGPRHHNQAQTKGCIRMKPEGVKSMKYRWDHQTPNRGTARVYIDLRG